MQIIGIETCQKKKKSKKKETNIKRIDTKAWKKTTSQMSIK